MSIEVRNVTKHFGDFVALKDVSLHVEAGELVALLGPSGSGKTTLLRVVAGLETADAGSVLFNGKSTAAKTLRERRVGFVFQHYALFRHMTVFENVAFGLRVRPRAQRPNRHEIRDRVMSLLKMVQLDNLAQRYPSQLSGGQRQRVALSRALAVEPSVLLLDEPFGALDARVRKDLRRWLRRLHDEIRVTSVFVTHDQEEALEVADRVVVMNQGAIEQVGSPEDVYQRPASPFVYHFLGDVNLFHARMQDGTPVLGQTAEGSSEHPRAQVFIRPHLLDIHTHSSGQEHFQARIEHINPAGPVVKLELFTAEGEHIDVTLSQERYRELALKRGSDVFLTAKEMSVFVEDYSI
ncbi:MAG: sulfate ABC transporter ATP-binding protein [Candidatus Hydrogenedentes bacterium]|nr:sulfate ABC transporter ATP-binding protein [Candidatus Hydrogenedentota bacterium]